MTELLGVARVPHPDRAETQNGDGKTAHGTNSSDGLNRASRTASTRTPLSM
jgi:hypothetical protein